MKKLKPVLQNILFKRYVNSLLNEQSIAPPPIRLPSAGYAPWKLPTPNAIRPTFELPVTPTEVSPGTTTIFPITITPTGTEAKTTEKLNFDAAQSIIKNEIESGLSKTKNQKELVDLVYTRHADLFTDPEYGSDLADFTGNQIKDRLGLAEPTQIVPAEPKPYEFPKQPTPEIEKPKPFTLRPSTAPIPEPEMAPASEIEEPSISLSNLIFPSLVPLRYSKPSTSLDLEPELETKANLDKPFNFRTATGSKESERIRKYEEEEGMEKIRKKPKEDMEIEPYEGGLFDVDADLLRKNILGKYSGTYRIE